MGDERPNAEDVKIFLKHVSRRRMWWGVEGRWWCKRWKWWTIGRDSPITDVHETQINFEGKHNGYVDLSIEEVPLESDHKGVDEPFITGEIKDFPNPIFVGTSKFEAKNW